MTDTGLTIAQLLLHEYEKLKDEQLARINTRDNLIYATLASLGAVVVGALQVRTAEFLLAMPPVSVALGWTYLANDQKISAIGRHIRTVLAPQLEARLDSDIRVFSWEREHRTGARRRLHKVSQLAVDLLTFCAPALVAAIGYLVSDSPTTTMVTIATIEMIAVATLAAVIVTHADLGRDPGADADGANAA